MIVSSTARWVGVGGRRRLDLAKVLPGEHHHLDPGLTVATTATLLTAPPHPYRNAYQKERGAQQNDRTLADGAPGLDRPGADVRHQRDL